MSTSKSTRKWRFFGSYPRGSCGLENDTQALKAKGYEVKVDAVMGGHALYWRESDPSELANTFHARCVPLDGRERATKALDDMSRRSSGKTYDPYYKPSEEDMEDARWFHQLARKNEAGTLTIKDAEIVLEYLEAENALIHDEGDGNRWVEVD